VTIYPTPRWIDYAHLLSDPTREDMANYLRGGELCVSALLYPLNRSLLPWTLCAHSDINSRVFSSPSRIFRSTWPRMCMLNNHYAFERTLIESMQLLDR
jgi:hypothetical protein